MGLALADASGLIQDAVMPGTPQARLPLGRPRRRPATMASGESDATTLAGVVERITFHNPDSGFCVLRVKVPGRRELATVVGNAATIAAGEEIDAVGVWANDLVHGAQFRSTSLRTAAPTSQDGMVRYLGSGLIRGIGPVYARKLVEAFGHEVFDVIEHHPGRLRNVEGIGPGRAAQIRDAWQGQKVVRDIMVFLYAHGVGTSRAVRIYKTYGQDAIATVSANPYRLARDIRGIGFVTADALGARLGIAPTATIRVQAGISYALTQALDDGHCGLPREQLILLTQKLLDVPTEVVIEALDTELRDGNVTADATDGRACVFLTWLHIAERTLAARLRMLAEGQPTWPAIDADRAIPWVEARLSLTLAPSQHDAVRRALASKLLVLTGGPGVGKTTILKAILAILHAKRLRLALCAPTGRAAKRMSEVTGCDALTIHRLLEVNPLDGGFRRGPSHPIEADLVVVDEVSMVDVPLMHALIQAVPPRTSVLLVGDVDQLPPVGPGQPLADIISSGAIPVVRLTEVFRQAAASRIITNAHRVNQGEMPELRHAGEGPSDFYFVEADSPADAAQKVVHLVSQRIPQRFGLHPINDIQVLCPMNRGESGARGLNLALQKVLNPPSGPTVQRFGWTFAVHDKVMQIENDYDKEVYNGDIGSVSRIDDTTGELTIVFDGRPVAYMPDELDRVVLAYATTVHKAQGSEYPAVVMPITSQHYPLLQRNLVYTGMTRGRSLVVIVGQTRALAQAVRGQRQGRRWSKLKDWLSGQAVLEPEQKPDAQRRRL